MAARLTDRKKKKIIADYAEMGSYNSVAKKYKVAASTVRRTCEQSPEMLKKAQEKKEQRYVSYRRLLLHFSALLHVR